MFLLIQKVTKLLFLNLLWLLACLPILTIYPATAALFGVTKKRMTGEHAGVSKEFLQLFKENFVQSFWIGIIWTVSGLILVFDLQLANQMTSPLRIPLFLITFFMIVLYLFTSIFMFPVMIHYQSNWIQVIKNSLLLSISQLFTTMSGLLVIGGSILCFVLEPATILISGSVTAHCLFTLCYRSFQKIERLKQVSIGSS